MAVILPYRLILASASPARRYLLTRAGYEFEVLPANVAEPSGAAFADARTFVQHTAWLKAVAVAQRLPPQPSARPALVLSADTIGWLDGEVIGKPADRADARRILRQLSGREHELWTGVCLWHRPRDWQIAWQEVSRVFMRPMSDPDREAYLDSRQWEGCSGAYAIQESDDPYIQLREGSLSNVIGLPMESLTGVLDRLAHLAT
jgi:septum formation protein